MTSEKQQELNDGLDTRCSRTPSISQPDDMSQYVCHFQVGLAVAICDSKGVVEVAMAVKIGNDDAPLTIPSSEQDITDWLVFVAEQASHFLSEGGSLRLMTADEYRQWCHDKGDGMDGDDPIYDDDYEDEDDDDDW